MTKYDTWANVIDYELIEYGRKLNGPDKETLVSAINLAKSMHSDNLPTPTNIMLGEDGSIIFESYEDNVYEAIEVFKSNIDTVVFINDEMVEYNSYIFKDGKPIMKGKIV